MELEIRQEKKSDYPIVFDLIQTAFADIEYSDGSEGPLVNRLRNSDAFIPELSLVAEVDGLIVGHILLTRIHIIQEDQKFPVLALAPVSVSPSAQKQGIGSKLILESHRIAQSLGYNAIALIGHADYYPRFGYKKAVTFDISFPFEVPDENCMVVELEGGCLNDIRGMIEYPKEFYG